MGLVRMSMVEIGQTVFRGGYHEKRILKRVLTSMLLNSQSSFGNRCFLDHVSRLFLLGISTVEGEKYAWY